MDKVSSIKCESKKMACSNHNIVAFYKFNDNEVGFYDFKTNMKLYTYNFGAEEPITSISWSDLGESIVIVAKSAIVFNFYTCKIELRFEPTKLKIRNAFLLSNRKLLLEYENKTLQLINRIAQIEMAIHFDTYKKYKKRIFVFASGILYTLNENFEILCQNVISFNKIESFDIYKGKLYYVDEKNIIKGRDYVFRGVKNPENNIPIDPTIKVDEIHDFYLTKHYTIVIRQNYLQVFNRHDEQLVLSAVFDDFFVDKPNERLFLLSQNVFAIYQAPREDFRLKLIYESFIHKEEEHLFDESDSFHDADPYYEAVPEIPPYLDPK